METKREFRIQHICASHKHTSSFNPKHVNIERLNLHSYKELLVVKIHVRKRYMVRDYLLRLAAEDMPPSPPGPQVGLANSSPRKCLVTYRTLLHLRLGMPHMLRPLFGLSLGRHNLLVKFQQLCRRNFATLVAGKKTTKALRHATMRNIPHPLPLIKVTSSPFRSNICHCTCKQASDITGAP